MPARSEDDSRVSLLLRRAPESRQDERIKYGLNARKLCARNTGARPYENEIIMRVKNDFGGRRRRIWARRASRETCIIMALVVRYDEESGYAPASPLANDAAAADYVVRRDKSASSALPRHRLGRSAQRTVSATRSAVRAKNPSRKAPIVPPFERPITRRQHGQPYPQKMQDSNEPAPTERHGFRSRGNEQHSTRIDLKAPFYSPIEPGLGSSRNCAVPSNFFALRHAATVDRRLPGVRRLYTTICRL